MNPLGDATMNIKTAAILVYDNVEVLDFAGPFEVFNVAGFTDNRQCFETHLLAQDEDIVLARGQFSVKPSWTFQHAPFADILVVPGGPGSRQACYHDPILDYVRAHYERGGTILSVCTGALIVARSGITQGRQATTHQVGLSLLASMDDSLTIHPQARIVDNGQIIFSAGVSASMDAALYLVAKIHGLPIATHTAQYMEYDWRYREADGHRVIDAS